MESTMTDLILSGFTANIMTSKKRENINGKIKAGNNLWDVFKVSRSVLDIFSSGGLL